MNKKILLFISLIISSLTLLYLLAANIFRDIFILTDWIIVSFNLSVKTIIEIYVLFKKKE